MWFSSSAGVSTSLSSIKSTSSACSTSASTKCPMRTLAITGIVTVAMISRITLIDAMRATPPSLRMSEGTRSSAITAHAPAFSAIFACSALVTSMITPPLSISARPTFTRHSFDPLLALPLPFTFFASILGLLSQLGLLDGVAPSNLFHFCSMTTNLPLPRARTSPATSRISPVINRFLPFCSVSRPSTTISFCTLTGFRYSTVNSAVTARTSRNRQTFPIASSRSVAIIPPCANPPPPWYLSPKTNRPTILRFTLSCSNVNLIPPALSPPHPKHLFARFGARLIVALKCSPRRPFLYFLYLIYVIPSDQRHSAAFRSSHPALPFAHFNLQQFRQRSHATRNLLFIQAGKAQPQRVRQRRLHVEVPSRRKQHASFFHVDQQFAGIESRWQLQPQTHAAFRPCPACPFRHVFAQRFIQRRQARGVNLAHLGDVLAEKSAPQEFRERRLRKLIGVQVGRLLHHAQSFNRRRRSDNPSDTQAGKCHFGKAIDVDHQVRAVELLQRRDAFLARMQPRVNVILHYRDLVPPRQLQYLAPRGQRHRRSCRILKIRREQDELDAVRRQRRLQRFQIQAQRRPRLRLRPHRNGEAPRARTVEDCHRSRIRRVFHNHGIARTHKRFADQVEGLLASIDLISKAFVRPGDSVIMENPTYPGAVAIFHGARARCLSVPMNTHAEPEKPLGLDLEALEATLAANRVKLILLTPDFHNPTGTSMPLASRRKVLELAGRHQVPVVEDHIYARLHAREERIPSLKQLDRSNLVIHIDSFAKVAFPGLRVGWIVAPAAAIERLRVVKQTTDLHTDQLAQATLAEFLRRGLFSKHVAKMRKVYTSRLRAVDQTRWRNVPVAGIASGL